jgi:hypothetical protein
MKKFFAVVFAFILANFGLVACQESYKVSLDLMSADITEALTKLSQQANVSIMGDSTVKGKVTCNLNDVTLEQALDTICKMNKLTWVKVYVSADVLAKQSPSEIFGLLDALRQLSTSALICEDPQAQKQVVFVPDASINSIDVSTISKSLNLKPVYLLRAELEVQSTKTEQKNSTSGLTVPPADPRVAASQLWNYFSQIPVEQRWEVMRHLRDMLFQYTTPEERERFFDRSWRRHRTRPDSRNM